MANSLLCALPWFLLGGALLGLLFWLPGWWWRDPPRPSRPWPDHPFGILWLTERARQALGDCATPGRLRRMTDKAIARRLHGFTEWGDEAVPTEAHYKTWQKQAAFICRGDYDGLLAYQHELLAGEPYPLPWPKPYPLPGGGPLPRPDLAALILAATLLLLALILFAISDKQGWCRDEPCPPAPEAPPPVVCPTCPKVTRFPTTINLSADMLFAYNRTTVDSEAARERIAENLKAQLQPFSKVRIVSIGAYTDPIGSTASNKKLALDRATTVRAFLNDIIKSAPKGQFVEDQGEPPLQEVTGPNPNDNAFWVQCFDTYFVKGAEPLDPLPPGLTDDRPPCRKPAMDSKGRYAACKVLTTKYSKGLKDYAPKAENFRNLTACLAPMRRVAISITAERDEYETVSTAKAGGR